MSSYSQDANRHNPFVANAQKKRNESIANTADLEGRISQGDARQSLQL